MIFKLNAIDSTQKTACRKVPSKMGELQPVSSNKRLKKMLHGSFQEMIMTPQHQLPPLFRRQEKEQIFN